MSHYIISEKAKIDIEEIWFYTVENWYRKQADKYVAAIHLKFSDISQNPDIGRSSFYLADDILKVNCLSHVIFYHKVEESIEILRVLHEKRDFQNYFNA